LKPPKLAEIRTTLEDFSPDYILTAAFGRILRPWLLELPRFGAYNLHASLLPRWRGPNPIAWAIRAQDSATGVTLMQMDEGIDTGPIVSQAELPISSGDTVATLTSQLARQAAQLWCDARAAIGDAPFPAVGQPAQGATTAPKFQMEDAHLDFSRPAAVVDAQARSVLPEPGAWVLWGDTRIKLLDVHAADQSAVGEPGRVTADGPRWRVACNPGFLVIDTIQPAGRRAMRPGEFMRGQHQSGGGLLR
jgi:methionyl-tRNA formyltransferase